MLDGKQSTLLLVNNTVPIFLVSLAPGKGTEVIPECLSSSSKTTFALATGHLLIS